MKQLYLNMRVWLVALCALCGLQTAWADEVTWTASEQGYANAAEVTEIAISDYVAGTFDKGTNNNAPKYYTTGTAVRAYGGNTLTITGNAITKIVFTFASGEGTNAITADTGDYANGTWEGSADVITFTIGGTTGHRRISSITVTYTPSGTPTVTIPKPTITPKTGTYFDPQEVTITTNVAGATIKYSFGEAEFTYTAPFTVSETTTVEAWIETTDGRSNIATATLTFGPIYTSIADFNAAMTATKAACRLTFDNLLVTYVNGSNNYLTDGRNGLLVYGSNLGLTAGDRISGSIDGQGYLYYNLPELTSPTLNVQTVSEGNEVKPLIVAAKEYLDNITNYANMYITIENGYVENDTAIAEGTRAVDAIPFKVANGDESVSEIGIYNQFKIALELLAEKFYNVTGIACLRDDAIQIYPLAYAEYIAPEPAADFSGQYYIINEGSGLFWSAGNDWGTRAAVNTDPMLLTLAQLEDGTYSMETLVNNGGTAYYFEGDFMDNATPKHLNITADNDAFIISSLNAEGAPIVYGYDGTSVLAKTVNGEGANYRWKLVTEEQMMANLAQATEETPLDATFLIKDANFGRNNRWGGSLSNGNNNADLGSAWSFEASNKNVSGDVTNYCVESFHAVFTMAQTLENVPNGVYSMTAQGFYREDQGATADTAVFYANDAIAKFPVKTGSENSMTDASGSFSNGSYTIDPLFFEVTDGTITLGARLEQSTNLWCIWDNFRLKYYGAEADIAALKFGELVSQLADAIAAAQEITEGSVPAIAYQYLQQEIADAQSAQPETAEDYQQLIGHLVEFTGEVEATQAPYAELKDIVAKLTAIAAVSTSSGETDIAAVAAQKLAECDQNAKYSAAAVQGVVDELIAAAKNYIATITSLTEEIDITFATIANATPTANSEGWTIAKNGGANNYDTGNNVGEFWSSAAATISQTVALPAGSFQLTAIALTRTDMEAKLFAGETDMNIATVGSGEVNNTTQANAWFNEGNGVNVLPFELSEGGEVNIGLKADETTADYWMVWRSFQLSMLPIVVPTYPITFVSEHGSIEFINDVTNGVAEGETVQFYLYGEEDWYSWSYEIKFGEEFINDDFVDGVHSFVMPAGPVTITHITKQKHTYTVAETENGTVTATSAGTEQGFSHEGREVNITVTPDDGFELDALTVATAEGAPVTVTAGEAEGTYTFTMPDADVIVTGTFKALPRDDYERALAAIESGTSYRIFTQVGQDKFYLNASGYLVSEAKKAGCFTFTEVNASGTLKPTGWNLGCKFTNPSLTGGSTGDITQTGHINVGSNDRNDWERQVFFLNEEGMYAVRSTNANSENWGANTYWDVIATDATLPNAGYSLQPSYVWQIEQYTDMRPAAFAKTQTWPATLQKAFGLDVQWTTNAQESTEGAIANINDGNVGSFFHSQWSGTGPDEDHYIQAQLPEAAQKFIIAFHKRNDNNRPTSINVSVGDGAVAQTITEGLPATAWYGTAIDLGTAADNVRFTVTSTNAATGTGKNNGHYFFTFGEFYIIASNELTDAAAAFLTAGDYTNLNDEDVELIDALDEQIQDIQLQLDMAEDMELLNNLVNKLRTQINATETYNGEDAYTTASNALDGLTSATYSSVEAVQAAQAQVTTIAQNFFGAIQAKEAIDITDWYIVNPTPVAHKTVAPGWEGETFGDSSDGVSEYWNKSGASFHQTINLPEGKFQLSAQAITRTNMMGTLFAGNDNVNIETVSNNDINDRAAAGRYFDADNGWNVLTFVNAPAGDVNIGIKADATTGDHWTVWRTFKLEMVEYTADDQHDAAKRMLDEALIELATTADSFDGLLGDKPYQFPEGTTADAQGVIETATAVMVNAESTTEALNEQTNIVKAATADLADARINAGEGRYMIALADTALYMSLAAEDQKAALDVMPHAFYFINEGLSIYISTEPAGEDGKVPATANTLGYVGYNTSTLFANKAALTFTEQQDGSVIISEANGRMGVDAKESQAHIFSDKTTDAAAAKWIIAEYENGSDIADEITITKDDEEVDDESTISAARASDVFVEVTLALADDDFANDEQKNQVVVRLQGTYTTAELPTGNEQSSAPRRVVTSSPVPFTIYSDPGETKVNLRDALGENEKFEYLYEYTFNVTNISAGLRDSGTGDFTAVAEKPLSTPLSIKLIVNDKTGIDAVTSAIAEGDIYDLQGRKVQNMRRGQIYVIAGKKVTVK